MSESFRNYCQLMRFDKPIGLFLLLWPVLWALWVANAGIPSLKLLSIFILGVIVTRAGGCVANDLADYKFDRNVARTRNRPLARDAISVFQALIVLAMLAIIALILVLQLNSFSLILACMAAVLIVFYPFSKRFFVCPQLILGIVFGGFGVLIAFAASLNHLSLQTALLFSAAAFWTIAFDTLYAMSDKEEDKKIKIHSSAIWFGNKTPTIITFLMLLTLACLIALGVLQHYNVNYYVILFALLLGIIFQWRIVCENKPDECFKMFLHNNYFGALIFLAIVLQYKI